MTKRKVPRHPDATRMFVWIRFATEMQPQTGVKLWLDPDWIHYRVHLFKQLTLRSLQRQLFRDFTIVLGCSPDTRQLLEPYAADLCGCKLVFDNGVELLAEQPSGCNWFSYVRIDSDDLFAPQALQVARGILRERPAVQFRQGFWWDIGKRIVAFDTRSSPPFYGVRRHRDEIANFDDFCNNQLHRRGRVGHVVFQEIFKPKIVAPAMYCVTVNAANHRAACDHSNLQYMPERVIQQFGVDPEICKTGVVPIPERAVS